MHPLSLLLPFALFGCGVEVVAVEPVAQSALKESPPLSCGAAWEGSVTTCPLQGWMRDHVGMTMTEGDLAGVAEALTRTSTWSPDPEWDWQRIATDGAAAARSSDEPGVRAACRACHQQYRPMYKARYRTRTLGDQPRNKID